MSLTSVQKADIVNEFKRADKDTGSPEVQVSLMTGRIKYLTDHFKEHKKDFHSRRGLQALVNKVSIRPAPLLTSSAFQDCFKISSQWV